MFPHCRKLDIQQHFCTKYWLTSEITGNIDIHCEKFNYVCVYKVCLKLETYKVGTRSPSQENGRMELRNWASTILVPIWCSKTFSKSHKFTSTHIKKTGVINCNVTGMYKEEHEFRFVCASDALCIATEAVERNRSQVWRLKGSIRRLSYDGLGLPTWQYHSNPGKKYHRTWAGCWILWERPQEFLVCIIIGSQSQVVINIDSLYSLVLHCYLFLKGIHSCLKSITFSNELVQYVKCNLNGQSRGQLKTWNHLESPQAACSALAFSRDALCVAKSHNQPRAKRYNLKSWSQIWRPLSEPIICG